MFTRMIWLQYPLVPFSNEPELTVLRILASLSLLIANCNLASAQNIIGTSSVIDGDTIEIRGERIRLHGIDAPESGQRCQDGNGQQWRCGQQAALFLSDALGRSTVTCGVTDVDQYDRAVAVCSTAKVPDVNALMVLEGWALAYRKYSMDYVELERQAAADKRGMWTGEFTEPWEWRRGKRLDPQQTTRPGCLIKGNINSKGDRIYHVPGANNYDDTRINASKGERWFCSKAEAVAAGWRAPR